MIDITIDGNPCKVKEGATIIAAAAANGVYVPAICNHPDLPPYRDVALAARVFRGPTCHENQPLGRDAQRALEGCGLCAVKLEGEAEPLRACHTPVTAGMSIHTTGEMLEELRRERLMVILARHPHACLTCAQREGCSLEDCSTNVPKDERCCSKFHNCELRKVAEYVGIKEQTPRYRPAGMPVCDDEPLLTRDFNLCIDCARCVRVCNQVRGVEALGIVHDGERLLIGSVAPTLMESACKFCGACVEVCPTGCLLDKGAQTGTREQRLVPCVHTCPAGADVPGYIRRIASGDFKAAAALIWETLPLPNVLGHICFHQCECECRRDQVDDPIAICALKRFALEDGNGAALRDPPKPPDSGRKAAIIGAGPAGLSAAFFLRLKGHAVTIFEASESAGGMPALSIPTYRLPPNVLEKDVSVIRSLGVEIKAGHRLATSEAMTALLDQGHDALLIAVGLPHSRRIDIAGASLAGVFWGLEFLSDVRAGAMFNLGRKIIVIGGGNVAIDAAMTARRLSGGSVRLCCLESRDEMPAHPHEIEKAEAEGVEINAGWGPAAIRGVDGKVNAIELRRCTAVFDEQHRFAPTFDERTRTTADATAVILAVGQAPPEGIPAEKSGVFLGGDITGGQMSVVHAVASGRAAAERIDKYLGGDGDVSVRLTDHPLPAAWIGREQGFAPRARVPLPCAAPEKRCVDFREIEGGYSRDAAQAEARRCLQCDLRLQIAPPELPPEKWLEFNQANVEQVPQVEGIFVLAGADKRPTVIKGGTDIQADLLERLEVGGETRFFLWEEDRMYTQRESELIQQHLKQYGELPGGGGDELDDLF